jgi:hypothetical protein
MVDILGRPELIEGDADGYRKQNIANALTQRGIRDNRVVSASLSAPPGSVGKWQSWILAGSGTGLWSGQAANTIAIALSDNPSSAAGWFFYVPQAGLRMWVIGTGEVLFNGSAWVAG